MSPIRLAKLILGLIQICLSLLETGATIYCGGPGHILNICERTVEMQEFVMTYLARISNGCSPVPNCTKLDSLTTFVDTSARPLRRAIPLMPRSVSRTTVDDDCTFGTMPDEVIFRSTIHKVHLRTDQNVQEECKRKCEQGNRCQQMSSYLSKMMLLWRTGANGSVGYPSGINTEPLSTPIAGFEKTVQNFKAYFSQTYMLLQSVVNAVLDWQDDSPLQFGMVLNELSSIIRVVPFADSNELEGIIPLLNLYSDILPPRARLNFELRPCQRLGHKEKCNLFEIAVVPESKCIGKSTDFIFHNISPLDFVAHCPQSATPENKMALGTIGGKGSSISCSKRSQKYTNPRILYMY